MLTHEDVPGARRYGLEFADQPVLAIDRVRYFGEAVALVAAEEPEQARRAAAAVRVEYEPLEPVVDPERATELEPLHPGRPTAGHGFRVDPRPNVVRSLVIRRGDPDAEGDVTVSATYDVGQQDQAFLGPESGLAIPDGEGGVDIHVATQWLHVDRDQVAPCLGLPAEMVRIHLAGVGGAFGGREDLSVQVHAALLALRTSRPVKMSYNREESFVGHIHRHPARIWAEHRATREGRLVSVRVRDPARRRGLRLEHRGRARERLLLRGRAVRRRQRLSSKGPPSTRTTRRAARCGDSGRCRRRSRPRPRWTGSPTSSTSTPSSSGS